MTNGANPIPAYLEWPGFAGVAGFVYVELSSILFLEPASSTKPQFPSVNDVGLRVTKGAGFTLLCPAQAFPVATYR